MLPSCAIAVIVVEPSATAVIFPSDTVATSVLLLIHIICLLLALLGLIVAVNVSVVPTSKFVSVLFIFISVTSCCTVTAFDIVSFTFPALSVVSMCK